ncbi:NPCC-domain-containing protein [Aspergillus sclerotioniger CBS 115572]|uniref:NPCC-domain-containing protein n=1 Tax=Aspergillus sclerotioniger CBS 115572 TaxID=1450535 RepID=A0A317XGG4_9EURO|nr:NPCC-domain-containing protein [Aspergillus sclerotioniger CBS 115572]PWY96378.1 NPCC-domain-containing protein [Aspergillus sclerotioniger CBS 115572]
MASPAPPSTPNKAASAPAPTPDGSQTPGKWRHPHLDEVVRRQNAGTFGDRNVNRLMWNTAALFATWVFGETFKSYSVWLQKFSQLPTYPDLSLLALRLIFALNILVALYPLFRPKDNFADIPLTPTQRSLLGLDPSSTQSLTPGSTYVTPPRYRLSASRNASPASRSGSPFSASAGASGRRLSSGASYSPSLSPLMQKLVATGGKEGGRRPSFGASSTLGRSSSFSPFKESTSTFKDSTSSFRESTSSFRESTSSFRESAFRESTMSTISTLSTMSSIAPATPSPVGGKRVNLGLSNKWLYERSRRLSASNGSL